MAWPIKSLELTPRFEVQGYWMRFAPHHFAAISDRLIRSQPLSGSRHHARIKAARSGPMVSPPSDI